MANKQPQGKARRRHAINCLIIVSVRTSYPSRPHRIVAQERIIDRVREKHPDGRPRSWRLDYPTLSTRPHTLRTSLYLHGIVPIDEQGNLINLDQDSLETLADLGELIDKGRLVSTDGLDEVYLFHDPDNITRHTLRTVQTEPVSMANTDVILRAAGFL